jgi:hypothetical protein
MTHQHRRTRARACEGKIRHPAKAGALAQLRDMAARGSYVADMEAYRCPCCSQPRQPAVWHIGHKRQGKP